MIQVQLDGSGPSCRAQHTVALWCPWYTLISLPVDVDHNLVVVSEDAARGVFCFMLEKKWKV